MKESILTVARRILRAPLALISLLGKSWRLWLGAALLGALLSAGLAQRGPRLWVSEGEIALRPVLLREGYLLSTNDLASHYAIRLQGQGRVSRLLAPLDSGGVAPTVVAWPESGAILRLRVTHPSPALSEALARALLGDFRAELEAENRTRQEADRLVVTLSPSSFARPAPRSLALSLLYGMVGGLVAGLGLALARAWRGRGRVLAPQDAEALMGVPTLAAIPPRRVWRVFPWQQ